MAGGTKITNAGGEAITLPYPLTGVLGAGKSCVVDIALATVATAVGTQPATGGLKLDAMPAAYTGPYDTAFEGAADADGTEAFAGAVTVGTTLDVTGDITAAGGFRSTVGPFYVTTAADQTAIGLKYGDTVGMAWRAPSAGSVLGVTGMIDAAVTGSGTTVKVRVYKALAAAPTVFTLLNAALDLDFTQAGAEVVDSSSVAKDTYTFAAGDMLKLVYTSTTITNTPKFAGNINVEY